VTSPPPAACPAMLLCCITSAYLDLPACYAAASAFPRDLMCHDRLSSRRSASARRPAAGRAFIRKILRAAVPSWDCVYRHSWEANDFVVWDNRQFMHRATPYDPSIGDGRRLMWRVTVAGGVSASTVLRCLLMTESFTYSLPQSPSFSFSVSSLCARDSLLSAHEMY
jgi:hypothetical protein